MILTFVEKLPERGRHQSDLQGIIKDFCKSNADIVKIEFTEDDYVSTNSCYNSWVVAVRRSKRPVKIVQRNKEVYLIKIK